MLNFPVRLKKNLGGVQMAGWSGIYTNDQEIVGDFVRRLTELGLIVKSDVAADPSVSFCKNGVWFWLCLSGYFHPLSEKLLELARGIAKSREKQEAYVNPENLPSQNTYEQREGAGTVLVYQAANNTTDSGVYIVFADGVEIDVGFSGSPNAKYGDGSNRIAAEYFLKRHNLEVHTDYPDNWRVLEDYAPTEKALQKVEKGQSSTHAAR